jgi:hypothetical protein
VAIGLFSLAACSTHGKTVPIGAECFQATDCGDGVVCVPQADGKRICSTDLSGVVSIEDAAGPPADASRGDANADASSSDAARGDAATSNDSGAPDTGAPGNDAALD